MPKKQEEPKRTAFLRTNYRRSSGLELSTERINPINLLSGLRRQAAVEAQHASSLLPYFGVIREDAIPTLSVIAGSFIGFPNPTRIVPFVLSAPDLNWVVDGVVPSPELLKPDPTETITEGRMKAFVKDFKKGEKKNEPNEKMAEKVEKKENHKKSRAENCFVG